MTLIGAAALLRVGRWVRRSAWPPRAAIFFDPGALDNSCHGFRAHDGALGSHRGSFSSFGWNFSLDDLLARDWETTDPSPGYDPDPETAA